jgi:hypothetical protein
MFARVQKDETTVTSPFPVGYISISLLAGGCLRADVNVYGAIGVLVQAVAAHSGDKERNERVAMSKPMAK